jgi:hypothetical protein
MHSNYCLASTTRTIAAALRRSKITRLELATKRCLDRYMATLHGRHHCVGGKMMFASKEYHTAPELGRLD